MGWVGPWWQQVIESLMGGGSGPGVDLVPRSITVPPATGPNSPDSLTSTGGLMVIGKNVWLAPSGGDDTANLTAAVSKYVAGGKIIIVGLLSVVTGQIALANANYLNFEGISDVVSGIKNNGTNDMFTVTGTNRRLRFKNMLFQNAAGAGHIFNAGNSVDSYWTFDDCHFDITVTPTKSVWSHTGAGNNCIGFQWATFTLDAADTASVPAWNHVNNNGGLNANVFRKGLTNAKGFYPFWFENTAAGGTWAADNKLEEIIFENPIGGCAKFRSVFQAKIDGCQVWDLTTSTSDLFAVDTGSGTRSVGVTFRNYQRHGGALGGGLADLNIDADGIYIETSDNTGSIFTIKAAAAAEGVVVNSGGQNDLITWLNQPTGLVVIGTNPGEFGGPWIAFTPTVSGTGWAIGNGTITGKYTRVGRTVFFQIQIVWGTTSTFGTGQLIVGLPFAAQSVVSEQFLAFGTHTGTGSWVLQSSINTANDLRLFALGANGALSAVTSTAPFTWASTDVLNIAGAYELAQT